MAETTYKKGELLLDENITTSETAYSYAIGYSSIQLTLEQDVLLINFNEVEYICEKMSGVYDSYGGVGTNGPDFSVYPFACYSNGLVYLFTENPGTYNFKIYTAVEDTDSDSSSEPVTIRSYIDKNLTNLNWNILPQIFESEGVELTEEIERYLRETPKNTNWNIFKDIGGSSSNIIFEGEVNISILYSSMQDYLIGFNFSNLNSITLPSDVTNVKITINSDTYELPLSSVPAKFFAMNGFSYYVDRYFGSDLRSGSGAPQGGVNDTFPCGLICNQIDLTTLELSVLLINAEIGSTHFIKIETL